MLDDPIGTINALAIEYSALGAMLDDLTGTINAPAKEIAGLGCVRSMKGSLIAV
jgi:hypothetical protein